MASKTEIERYAEKQAEPLRKWILHAWKNVERLEERAKKCGCASCYHEAWTAWEKFVDDYIVPDEEEHIRCAIEKYVPKGKS